MYALTRFLVPDKENIIRRGIIFNTLSNTLDAAQSMILLVVVTRVCGTEVGGIFSISMAIAYQMMVIGKYGIRDFQATDIRKEFSFSEYYCSRMITSFLMYIWLAIYVFWNGYSHEKAAIVIAVAIYKSIDVLEDVYHGYYQREERLDSACLAQTIRYGLTIVLYLLLLFITRNLLLSTALSTAFSLFLFLVLNRALRSVFSAPAFSQIQWSRMKGLLVKVTPLGIVSILQLYITNYPKFFIDSHMTDVEQAYYGALSMPVFVINLLSLCVYRPLLTRLAQYWQSRDVISLKKLLLKQCSYIGIMSLLILAAGYLFGIPILSFIYGIDLAEYRTSLMVLLGGGGLVALSGFMMSVVIVMRMQKYLVFGYITTVIVELLAASYLVQGMGILGASILFTISMLILGCTASGVVGFTIVRTGTKRK